MAKFHDQFQKRDPLTFNAFGIVDFWPRAIAWEARDLLEGRKTSHLKKIATAVEALIEAQLTLMMSKPDVAGDPRYSANPKALEYGSFMSVQEPNFLRVQHGDVNLYLGATTSPGDKGLKFEQWEGLAVLALWKLIDFFETVTAPRRELGNRTGLQQPTDKRKYQALLHGAPDLVEAMRACTLAGETKMRLKQLAAMDSSAQRQVAEALYAADAKRRIEVSNKSRAAVAVRHSKIKEHQAEAMREALSRPFKSRAEAARHAAEMVQKSPGIFYTSAVIDGWLKALGWQSIGVSTA